MKQALSTWRYFIAGVIVAVAVLLSAGSASAHSVGFAGGFRWYYAGTDFGGTIWCAGNDGFIEEYTYNAAKTTIKGSTQTNKDLYCSNYAPQPAGYIGVSTRMLWASGTVCVNWLSTVTYNANNVGYAFEPRANLFRCGAGDFKTEVFSSAALIFDWRYDLYSTGTHYWL